MTTARKHSEGAAGLATVRDVEVFARGNHRGEPYTDADLDDMVRNFNDFCTGPKPLVTPTVVIGHEEEQDLLDNTGIPAVGRPENLRRCPGRHHAGRFRRGPRLHRPPDQRPGLPQGVRRDLPRPPEGVPGTGKMLRRIALLGGELPHIKSLADLPLADYAEQTPLPVRRVVLKFSDATQPAGQAFVRCFAELADAEPDDPTEEGERRKLSESYRAYKAKYGEKCRLKMSEDSEEETVMNSETPPAVTPPATPPAPAVVPAPVAPAAAYSEATIQKLITDGIAAGLAQMEAKFGAKVQELDKFAEDRLAAEKKSTVKARLDALVVAGKVLPAEIDGGIADTIFTLDSRAVRKFAEAGKEVERTAFDHFFAVLEARPVLVKFAERCKAPASADAAGDETEKVRQYAHKPEVAHALKAAGRTPEQYVAKFSELLKQRPDLTAAQYGVTA
jgi:hypothetical protein